MSRPAAIAILAVIIIVLAAGTYLLFFGDKVTNTGNTNAAANINSSAISNSVINTNSVTKEWNTYTNSTFGYTIEYPSDWKVFITTSVVTEFAPETNTFYLEGSEAKPVVITGYLGSVNDYLNQVPDNEETSILIGGQSAIKIQEDLGAASYVFVNKNIGSYMIVGTNEDLMRHIEKKESEMIETIFNSMLQTFKIR